MDLRGRAGLIPFGLLLLIPIVAGCPLKFENEPRTNTEPFTYFEVAPGDTSFSDRVTFIWRGTDLDSDVVAYQFQLVETDSLYLVSDGLEGRVLRSIVPRREFGEGEDDELWTDRTTDTFEIFFDLADGWYEMRARAIDDRGLVDSTPARHRFLLNFDNVLPEITIETLQGGNLGTCARIVEDRDVAFIVTISDVNRRGIPTPYRQLAYRYELQDCAGCPPGGGSCGHRGGGFAPTEGFKRIPFGAGDSTEVAVLLIDGTTIVADGGPTTSNPYTRMADNCGWDFTVEVVDPAGNPGKTICTINTGCQCGDE
jgi:hypothetical protein